MVIINRRHHVDRICALVTVMKGEDGYDTKRILVMLKLLVMLKPNHGTRMEIQLRALPHPYTTREAPQPQATSHQSKL